MGWKHPLAAGFVFPEELNNLKPTRDTKMQQRLYAAVWAAFIFVRNLNQDELYGNC